MTHPEPEVLAAVASGEPVPQDLRRHVDGCGACAREVARLDGVVERLRGLGSAGSEAPGDHVWAAVREATRPSAAVPADVPEPSPAAVVRRTAPLLAAALVGAVVGAGVVGVTAWQSRESPAPPAASPSVGEGSTTLARSALRPVGGATTAGTVALVRTDRGMRVDVRLDQVDDVPAGHYLEVWMFDPRTLDMTSVGVLDGRGDARFALPTGMDLETYTGVDVSLEPLDADPAHGTSVAQALLG